MKFRLDTPKKGGGCEVANLEAEDLLEVTCLVRDRKRMLSHKNVKDWIVWYMPWRGVAEDVQYPTVDF